MIDSGSVALLVLGLFLLLPVAHAMAYAVTASYISDLFEPRVRYTGSALAYQLGGVVTSAPAPFVAGALIAWSGSSAWIAAYMAAGSVVALLGLLLAGNHRGLLSHPNAVPDALPTQTATPRPGVTVA
jgi:MFS family permease